MPQLTCFNFISLDGYYKGVDNDIHWHRHGEEESQFSAENMKSGNTLLFGRVTYELMAGYWPSPMAMENSPVVAAGMNNANKIVFSRTLTKADWENTRLIKENIVEEIRKLKKIPGKDMTILGSGSIITQFAEAGLIDDFQFMIDPVVLGKGTPIFKNIHSKMDLELLSSRVFKSGTVLLTYRPLEG